MILVLFFLAFTLGVPEHLIRLNEIPARLPRGVTVSRGGREVYATLEGLNALGSNYTILETRSGTRRYRHLPSIDCVNPLVCRRFVIGKTVRGNDIVGLHLSNFSLTSLPEFGWQSTIHGNEITGVGILLRLAYNLQTQRLDMLNRYSVFIIPILNPDGYVYDTRANANGFDLNRNFPDRFQMETKPLQPETRAIITWMNQRNYTQSATYHGGDLVVNYPYDCNREHRSGMYEACPDDAVYRKISREYAKHHRRMNASREFPGGITNGNHWYCITGSLQDWMYIQRKTLEVTIEVSYVKGAEGTDDIWKENRESIYAFMEKGAV